MKLTKKLLLILSALVLALGILTACGGTVKISFDSDGGTAVETITAKPGEEVTLPTPEKEGFAFDGWYVEGSPAEGTLKGTITAPDRSTKYRAAWSEGYALTLDLNGGSLPDGRASAVRYLNEGDLLLDALKDLTPAMDGALFGAWRYTDGREAGAADRMPKEGLTLKAGYTVEYTVRVFLQDVAQQTNVLSEEETRTLRGYVGDTVTPEIEVFGFHPAEENNGQPTSLVLKTGRNTVNLYFDRDEIAVTFDLNLPDGRSRTAGSETVVFGGSFTTPECPAEYAVVGRYRFAGWSKAPAAPGSAADYRAGAEAAAEGYTALYGVWDVGATDRDGGADIVFFPQFEEGKAVLSRGGVQFEGVREGDSFSFRTPGGGTLAGKVFGEVFSYRNEALEGTYVYFLPYDDGETPEADRFDRSTTLVVDAYMNATYGGTVDADGDGTPEEVEMRGVLLTADASRREYAFLVLEGDYMGYGFPLRFGERQGTPVFLESQGEAGEYYGFVRISGGRGYVELATGNYIDLDGFGGIVYADNESMNYWEGEYWLEEVYYNQYTGDMSCVVSADVYETDLDGNRTERSMHLEFYTIYLDDVDTHAYVERTELAGSYTGKFKDGDAEYDATLTLDGLEIFESATLTYEKDGAEVTYTSAYTVTRDVAAGTCVTIAISPSADGTRSFTLGVEYDEEGHITNAHTFTEFFPAERAYVAYYLLENGAINYPMIEIYTENGGRAVPEGAQYAELLYEIGGSLVAVAKGYVTSEVLGTEEHHAAMYTFTYTGELSGAYDPRNVPHMMKFLLNNVTNGTDNFDVYYRFEVQFGQDDAPRKLYTEIDATDGSKLYLNSNIDGMGSLFFKKEASGTDVYDGSLRTAVNEIGQTIGTFQWIDAANATYAYFYLYFDVDQNGAFNDFTCAGTTPPVETAMFAMRNGVMDNTMATVILYGDITGADVGAKGDMIYSQDGEWAQTGELGTWEVTGYTVLGDKIFFFRGGDGTSFFFTWDRIDYNDGGTLLDVYRYWRRDDAQEDYSTVYTSAEYGTIRTDGFRSAAYTAKDNRQTVGIYYLTADRHVLCFTATDGTRSRFELGADGSFVPLNEAYGYYEIMIGSDLYYLYFDGEQTVILTGASKEPLSGYRGQYRIVEGDTLECAVVMTEGTVDGRRSFTVRIEDGVLAFRSDDERGVYLDGDWNLLVLDGYGEGQFYSAADGSARRGYFNIVDGDLGGEVFAFLRFEDYSELFFAYKAATEEEAATFRLMEYTEDFTYYNDNFSDFILFRTDGRAYIGNDSGYYAFTDTAAHVYLLNAQGGERYMHVTLPLPGPSEFVAAYSYSYIPEGQSERVTVTNPEGHTAYYRYRGEKITVSGTATGIDGTITLTFTPDGRVPFNLPVTVKWQEGGGEQTAEARFISRYTPVEGGAEDTRREPILFYNGSYSFFRSFRYVPGGTDNAFVGQGGEVDRNLYEDFDYKTADGVTTGIYSTLTFYYTGFGPIGEGDGGGTKIKGSLYYLPKDGKVELLDACKVTFDGVPLSNRKTVDVDEADGTRYMIDFLSGGVRYALFYYEDTDEGNYFTLYAFTTYSEVQAGEYTVGVAKYVYANYREFYNAPEAGDPLLLVLRKGNEVIRSDFFGSGFNADGTRGFLVDVIPERASTGAAVEGHGYYLTLTYGQDSALTGASVEEYAFVQAHTEDGDHIFNFFVGADGMFIFSMMTYDASEGFYYFVPLVSCEDMGEGSYKVTSSDGYVYTVTVRYTGEGESREPVYSDDRVSWVVTVTAERLPAQD